MNEMANDEQVQSWKDRLPNDLKYGIFADDFDIAGVHYKHGAWNLSGDYWMAWNTEEEFQEELDQADFSE